MRDEVRNDELRQQPSARLNRGGESNQYRQIGVVADECRHDRRWIDERHADAPRDEVAREGEHGDEGFAVTHNRH